MKVEKSNIPTTSWEQKPGDTINCNDPLHTASRGSAIGWFSALEQLSRSLKKDVF